MLLLHLSYQILYVFFYSLHFQKAKVFLIPLLILHYFLPSFLAIISLLVLQNPLFWFNLWFLLQVKLFTILLRFQRNFLYFHPFQLVPFIVLVPLPPILRNFLFSLLISTNFHLHLPCYFLGTFLILILNRQPYASRLHKNLKNTYKMNEFWVNHSIRNRKELLYQRQVYKFQMFH